jgi:hypothetical protein
MRKMIATVGAAFAVASGFALAAPVPEAQATPCPAGVPGAECGAAGSQPGGQRAIQVCAIPLFGYCANNLGPIFLQAPDGSWYPK